MTRTVSPPAPRPAAMAAVLARSVQWTTGRRKSDGRAFYIVPGSRAGVSYYADATDCTCPDARERGRTCKHSMAIRQYQERQQIPASDADLLARLQREFAERGRVCRLIGYLPGEEHEDARYAGLADQIGKLTARLGDTQQWVA